MSAGRSPTTASSAENSRPKTAPPGAGDSSPELLDYEKGMMSCMDKLTYSTTYRQDFGKAPKNTKVEAAADPGQVECRPRAYHGEAIGRAYENPLGYCPCGSGGSMTRGAHGLPANSENPCSCSSERVTHTQAANKENVPETMHKMPETEHFKTGCTTCRKADPSPFKQHPTPLTLAQPVQCPRQEKFRPVPIGQFGGQFEGPLNREPKENDQAMPYSFDKPCMCPPGQSESGPQNYGPAWIRDRTEEQAIEPRMTGGKQASIPQDVAKLINAEAPAARVGCAPEADVSKYDQPNTFMRKLYDKYPYLYQILRDTPPEELIARVFKDRFLSTYQVDYLHMGPGKEHFPRGGVQLDEKFVSPEGENEPNLIPGCTYRSNKRGNFGRKKSTLKMKEKEDEDDEEPVREEPRISEYMASISKLGGEIIADKLFEVKATTRKAVGAGKSTA